MSRTQKLEELRDNLNKTIPEVITLMERCDKGGTLAVMAEVAADATALCEKLAALLLRASAMLPKECIVQNVTQVAKAGAVVKINQGVMDYGCIFLSETRPPLLLTFAMKEGKVYPYQFEEVFITKEEE